MQALNSIKVELQQLVAEQNRLEKEKDERLAQQASFESDYNNASAERDKTEQVVRRMRLEQQDTDQPKIVDYIKIKHEVMVRPVAAAKHLITLMPRPRSVPVGTHAGMRG